MRPPPNYFGYLFTTHQPGKLYYILCLCSGRELVIADQQTLFAVDLLASYMTSRDVNMTLTSLSVNYDDVICVSDDVSVYAVTSQLPRPHHVTGNYDVADPTTLQRYTFNRSVSSLTLCLINEFEVKLENAAIKMYCHL